MLKTYLENIITVIFFPIWTSFVFIGISTFSFIILTILSDFNIAMAIVATIFFVPFALVILFLFYLVAMTVNKEIDKGSNKTIRLISKNIIPPIVFFVVGMFSSVIEKEDKFEYYLSIPLAFLIMYFFDKIIKFLEKPKKTVPLT